MIPPQSLTYGHLVIEKPESLENIYTEHFNKKPFGSDGFLAEDFLQVCINSHLISYILTVIDTYQPVQFLELNYPALTDKDNTLLPYKPFQKIAKV